ncbi:lysophospholipid acyltransferase family protein [Dinghuibacter silviterrae]|nr:lysophospholipid acyltransferase family protein [Dinghuibacter silviterrae]
MSKLAERIRKIRIVKALVYSVVGALSYPGLALRNRMIIRGTEHLEHLPDRNVLFVSNHQTYFVDVIAFLHIFCAVKWGKRNKLGIPYYLLSPYTNVHYVAAHETISKNWVTRIYSLAGAISVKRTWVQGGKEVRRGLDPSDTRKVERALDRSWVITFPQGTTKPFAPGRKGTAYIIKKSQPIVVPIVIGGFWRAFKKKGIGVRKAGTQLTVDFKPPLDLDYNESTERILEQIMDAIEQGPEHAHRHHPHE